MKNENENFTQAGKDGFQDPRPHEIIGGDAARGDETEETCTAHADTVRKTLRGHIEFREHQEIDGAEIGAVDDQGERELGEEINDVTGDLMPEFFQNESFEEIAERENQFDDEDEHPTRHRAEHQLPTDILKKNDPFQHDQKAENAYAYPLKKFIVSRRFRSFHFPFSPSRGECDNCWQCSPFCRFDNNCTAPRANKCNGRAGARC